MRIRYFRKYCNYLVRKYLDNDAPRNSRLKGDTKEKYASSTNRYTKERHLLHKNIVSLMEKSDSYSKKGNNPIAILIGGGTATGKTTMRRTIIEGKLQARKMDATMVDLDEIKKYIPEYMEYKKENPMEAASLVHRESYDIGELLLKSLIRKGMNFVYEGTMARRGKYKNLVHELKKRNYEVHVYIVDIPLYLAKKRAKDRSEKTGRIVPNAVIENTHKLVPRTFRVIKDLVDSYKIYENIDDFKLIASNDFTNQKQYKTFLEKAKSNKD